MGQNFIDITDQGGSTAIDNIGALNLAIQAARSQGRKAIYLPGQGEWNISAPPNDLSGITLFGDSPSSSILVANYNGDCITLTGAGGMGGGMRTMTLWRGNGYSGGAGIKLVGTNASSPDYAIFEHVCITEGGGGTFTYPLMMDGTLRTTIQGVRDVFFQNVNLFAGTLGAASLMNIVGCKFFGVSCYPAGGSAAGVFIGGGSSTNFFMGGNIQDQLNITHAEQILHEGGVIESLNTDSTGSYCRLTGKCSNGPVTASNLQNSYVDFT